MAHAPILSRSDRAVGIRERHELHLRDDGTWQVRDTSGSGRWHTLIDGHCDCPEYVFRHTTCKHPPVVAAEDRQFTAYYDDWNARSEQARAALTPEDLDWLSMGFDSESGRERVRVRLRNWLVEHPYRVVLKEEERRQA